MDGSNIINMFLGVLLVVIVILLLQYLSPLYVFTLLFFIATLLYIITLNQSEALTWLVVFMVAFFVLQYIYFKQNIILTVSPGNVVAKPDDTKSTASNAVPAAVPPKTVWYLSFQSD